MQNKKIIKILWSVLGALLLIVAVGMFFVWKETKKQDEYQLQMGNNIQTDWKTHTNTEFGFAFNYPSEMVVTTYNPSGRFQTGVNFSVSEPDSKWLYGVDVKANTKNQTLEQAFDENYNFWKNTVHEYSDYQLKDFATSDIKVGGMNAKQLYINNFGDVGSTMVILVHKEHVYLIAGGHKKGDLDKFLASFKFVGTVDISDSKTYTNTEYGFEFRYPSDFRFSADYTNNRVQVFVPQEEPIYEGSVGFAVGFNKNAENNILNEACKYEEVKKHPGTTKIEVRELQGIPAIYTEELGMGSTHGYCLNYKENTFYIYMDDGVTDYDQILSTFKFID